MTTDKNGKELKVGDEVKTDDNMRFTIKRFNNFGGAECASDLQPLWVFLPTELTLFSSAECILPEPNKPMQYVVNYKIDTVPSRWLHRGKMVSWAIPMLVPYSELNDLCYGSIGGMKDAVLKEFNSARLILALPPITMDQITFVEI